MSKKEKFPKVFSLALSLSIYVSLTIFSCLVFQPNANLDEFWSVKYRNGIFCATMSQQRMRQQFLALCLRFDSKLDETTRKAMDKFAPIRELWNIFVNYCIKYYTPFENSTIDES